MTEVAALASRAACDDDLDGVRELEQRPHDLDLQPSRPNDRRRYDPGRRQCLLWLQPLAASGACGMDGFTRAAAVDFGSRHVAGLPAVAFGLDPQPNERAAAWWNLGPDHWNKFQWRPGCEFWRHGRRILRGQFGDFLSTKTAKSRPSTNGWPDIGAGPSTSRRPRPHGSTLSKASSQPSPSDGSNAASSSWRPTFKPPSIASSMTTMPSLNPSNGPPTGTKSWPPSDMGIKC